MVIDTGINYNLTAGTSVGLQPTYQWNAKVTSGTIQIYDAEGNAVADSYTSEGDHITILSICPSEYTQLSLALIQFPDQSNSCYIQGYIQTSDFNLLECRFNNSWVDTTNNQQIIFANGDLADRTLNAGDYQTYLYATDNYACISFLNDDNAFKSGFVPLSSGNLNIIQTDIPFYLAPGSSVGTEPSYPSNATTIASQIEIVDINGITIPNNYTSNGDNITILDVYMNEKLALIEFPDSYAGTYIIGYIPVENLINGNIKLKSNYCNWNSSTKEYSIYDLQKSVIYKIESSQTTEYLFKTNAYACILFNNNNVSQWPLETGFVSLGDGSFGLGKSNNTTNTHPSSNSESNNSEYLRGIDLSYYYEGAITDICNYFLSKGTPLSIAQVELVSGTTETYSGNANIQDAIIDIKNNNLKLGYYAFLYPYTYGYANIEEQAHAFVDVYLKIKDILGITPDCKIMIDIELGAFQALGVTPSADIVTNMINTFVQIVNASLGVQEYVVYSSASFISEYFSQIDPSKYGLIVSSVQTANSIPMNQIIFPTKNYTPLDYNDYPNNWGNKWTGVQFAFGSEQDYDIYTNAILKAE